jgi:hypothetical protein
VPVQNTAPRPVISHHITCRTRRSHGVEVSDTNTVTEGVATIPIGIGVTTSFAVIEIITSLVFAFVTDMHR